ncbi:hypothetical protein AB0M02_30390 [Actinoplanes sp. NPDC051861]
MRRLGAAVGAGRQWWAALAGGRQWWAALAVGASGEMAVNRRVELCSCA